ncbi:HEPN domain-containing protein [Sinomonas gamaensis]|uniref:ApeA N-terminal domain 1-containing protein n=1 Tax=Sinomonas gamaensis TaxID=2565624 RepID=UPI001109E190|nr:HEPN domain-containing protein [Sinomonas gamaensis]
MTDRTFVGKWWLPSAPERAVGGILTVDASGGCHLQLTGSLLPNPHARSESNREVDEPAQHLHGSADDEDFTLIDAWVTNFAPLLGDEPQEIRVHAVLRGVHLESPDQPCFTASEVEIDNLTAWSGITGFESSQEYEVDENGAPRGLSVARWELRTPSGERPVGDLGDFTVELRWQSTFSIATKDRNARREVSASEEVHAMISSSRPMPWDGFQGKTKILQDLITFATRHACAIRSVKLIHDEPEVGEVELLYAPLVQPAEDAPTTIFRYVFQMRDMRLGELLPKWYALHTKVGMGIHVLFGLDYNSRGFIENQILNATSAAESIHRALRPEARSIPEDAHGSLVEMVNERIDHENRDWLLERLNNGAGFVQRMRELVNIPAAQAVAEVVGDANQWVRWARDARNAVAHLEGRNFERIPSGARWGLPAATIGLLHLVLLAELGFSNEVQTQAGQNIYAPRATRFREAVTERMRRSGGGS